MHGWEPNTWSGQNVEAGSQLSPTLQDSETYPAEPPDPQAEPITVIHPTAWEVPEQEPSTLQSEAPCRLVMPGWRDSVPSSCSASF